MSVLTRIILAVVVGVAVYLVAQLGGGLLTDLRVAFALTLGGWLEQYAGVLGLLAALWYFFAGGGLSLFQRPPPNP